MFRWDSRTRKGYQIILLRSWNVKVRGSELSGGILECQGDQIILFSCGGS